MKRNIVLVLLGVLLVGFFTGCSAPKEEPTASEQALGEFDEFEKEAVEAAKEFVLATQGDKEKIKKLSFPSLIDHIEEKNWSIMLVEELKLQTDSFEISTEKLGPKQVLVNLSYKGQITKEDEIISVELFSKIGVVEHDGKPLVFSIQ
ncbi:MAG: hypothetical protein GXW85_11435 [Clostridia bacterium]|nr:hypothetical protein [Clostridia bacterium]